MNSLAALEKQVVLVVSTCVCVCVCVCLSVCLSVCVSVCRYEYARNLCVCVRMTSGCVYMYVCEHRCVSACARAQMSARAYVRARHFGTGNETLQRMEKRGKEEK